MPTILVVDDEEMIRTPLKAGLLKRGFNVIEARDGQEAIDQTATNKVDLILLDLLMPNLHGTGVIGKLKEKGLNIPVIVLTNVEATAIQEGVLEYIIKSETTVEKIIDRINYHLAPH